MNHAFSGDASVDTSRYSIWNLSRASSVDMTEEEIVYAAAFDKGFKAVRKSMRGALIASNTQVRRRLEE